jgi:hypothetical protein
MKPSEADVTLAALAVVAFGRVYVNQRKYLSLKLFTREEETAQRLMNVFGGRYYAQGVGFVWALGHQRDLLLLADIVRPHRKVYDHLDLLFELADKNPPP